MPGTADFLATEGITSVPRDEIAVIALFTHMDDAIAAELTETVLVTSVPIYGVAVITLLSGICDAISAEREYAVGAAGIGAVRIPHPCIALLAFVDGAISAFLGEGELEFPGAGGGASVSTHPVSVITFFIRVPDGVSAGRPEAGGPAGIGESAVHLAGITFLPLLHDAVPASDFLDFIFLLRSTPGGTSVPVCRIAVIALLAPVCHVVPAVREMTIRTAAIGGAIRIRSSGIAGFAEVGINDAISARGAFAGTAAGIGQTVGILFSIIAFFHLFRVDDPVPALGECAVESAGVRCIVGIERTIITLLFRFLYAIAAEVVGRADFAGDFPAAEGGPVVLLMDRTVVGCLKDGYRLLTGEFLHFIQSFHEAIGFRLVSLLLVDINLIQTAIDELLSGDGIGFDGAAGARFEGDRQIL